VLIAILSAATILALVVCVFAGRLAGLGITTACGAMIAFFGMPPLYSFRVAETPHILMLSAYGIAGLVIAGAAPRKHRDAQRASSLTDEPSISVETNLLDVLDSLLSNSRFVDVAIDPRASVPCSRSEARLVLSDVLSAALNDPDAERISISASRLPSVFGVTIVAHRVWPPPLGEVIAIGKGDEDCHPASFPGWPANSRANWFDNGYDRVYQISFELTQQS
jgi:hypothetical protein